MSTFHTCGMKNEKSDRRSADLAADLLVGPAVAWVMYSADKGADSTAKDTTDWAADKGADSAALDSTDGAALDSTDGAALDSIDAAADKGVDSAAGHSSALPATTIQWNYS